MELNSNYDSSGSELPFGAPNRTSDPEALEASVEHAAVLASAFDGPTREERRAALHEKLVWLSDQLTAVGETTDPDKQRELLEGLYEALDEFGFSVDQIARVAKSHPTEVDPAKLQSARDRAEKVTKAALHVIGALGSQDKVLKMKADMFTLQNSLAFLEAQPSQTPAIKSEIAKLQQSIEVLEAEIVAEQATKVVEGVELAADIVGQGAAFVAGHVPPSAYVALERVSDVGGVVTSTLLSVKRALTVREKLDRLAEVGVESEKVAERKDKLTQEIAALVKDLRNVRKDLPLAEEAARVTELSRKIDAKQKLLEVVDLRQNYLDSVMKWSITTDMLTDAAYAIRGQVISVKGIVALASSHAAVTSALGIPGLVTALTVAAGATAICYVEKGALMRAGLKKIPVNAQMMYIDHQIKQLQDEYRHEWNEYRETREWAMSPTGRREVAERTETLERVAEDKLETLEAVEARVLKLSLLVNRSHDDGGPTLEEVKPTGLVDRVFTWLKPGDAAGEALVKSELDAAVERWESAEEEYEAAVDALTEYNEAQAWLSPAKSRDRRAGRIHEMVARLAPLAAKRAEQRGKKIAIEAKGDYLHQAEQFGAAAAEFDEFKDILRAYFDPERADAAATYHEVFSDYFKEYQPGILAAFKEDPTEAIVTYLAAEPNV